jgi:uncharacterized membrane protein
MTGQIDPVLQERIDAYLKRLRQALGALPPEEIADIVREIRGHIIERAEATASLNQEALTRILNALGDPDDIAALYQSRAMVARARASTSPSLILMAAIRWAGMSVIGLVTFVFGVFGYVMGIGLFVTALLKVLYPDRVGVWVGPHGWDFSMGVLSAAEQGRAHAHEVLGSSLVPVALLAGPIILIITTVLLRWALRFAFQPARADTPVVTPR